MLQRLGVELVPVPLEADGLDLGALEAALARGPDQARPRDPQLPQPGRLHPLGREAGRAWSSSPPSTDFWIFEDDPYRELPFEGEALGDDALDRRADRVVHASSFSKTVSPGVRVGYLAGPAELIAKLAKTRQRDLHLTQHAGRVGRPRALPLGRPRPQHRVRQGRPARAPRRPGRALGERIPEAEFVVPGAATSSGSTSPRAPTRRRSWPRPRATASPSSPAPTS